MQPPTFPILILNARPGAGKSEIIDFLRNCPLSERQQRFHINNCDIFDDFPILWSWFEEDDLLVSMGYPRLHTNDAGYFIGHHMWHLLIKRLGQEYEKRVRDIEHYNDEYTAIIEFSRGSEHGGYATAYSHLTPTILQNAAILYVNVSWDESVRKNKARYNPEKPDSILQHGLDDEKMARLYRYDDWLSMKENHQNYVLVKGIKVPCVIFENEDDVTTDRGIKLGERLESTLHTLWRHYSSLHNDA